MRRIYAAMEEELLVVEGVESPRAERRLDDRKPRCLAADPLRPELIYCGTADRGLWRSTDAGDSWEPVGEGITHANVTAVAVSAAERTDGRGVVYAGTEPSTLFRSEDGGGSWRELEAMRRLPSFPEWSFPPKPETSHVRWISPDPAVPGRLFVCIEAGALIRSYDGGETWVDRVSEGPLDTHTLAVREDAPGRLYSAAGDGFFAEGGGYLESPDGGDTWERHPEGLTHHYLWGLAVDPQDPNTVLISASSGPMQAHSAGAAESTVYRREDGGPWQEVRGGLPDTEGTIASVLDAAEPGVFYALNNHGLYRSPDAGKNWERLDVSWPERYLRQHPQALLVTEDVQ
jgi:photosystem II stability/assembly factor-like uncharacterized protein